MTTLHYYTCRRLFSRLPLWLPQLYFTLRSLNQATLSLSLCLFVSFLSPSLSHPPLIHLTRLTPWSVRVPYQSFFLFFFSPLLPYNDYSATSPPTLLFFFFCHFIFIFQPPLSFSILPPLSLIFTLSIWARSLSIPLSTN